MKVRHAEAKPLAGLQAPRGCHHQNCWGSMGILRRENHLQAAPMQGDQRVEGWNWSNWEGVGKAKLAGSAVTM